MKKLILSLLVVAFGAAISFAQAPAKPAAPAPAAKADTKQAAPVADAAAKPAAKKPAAKKPAATHTHKMTHKCPKGCALTDAAGKCPKCGADMVAMAPAKAKKAAAKTEAKPAAPAAAPAEKK